MAQLPMGDLVQNILIADAELKQTSWPQADSGSQMCSWMGSGQQQPGSRSHEPGAESDPSQGQH